MTKTAMILAAGLGSRMGALTRTTPKPLLKIKGTTLLHHQLISLKNQGIQHVVINVAYLAEHIIAALQAQPINGLKVDFSVEEIGQWGTGGGILNALKLLGEQPFLLHSADVVSDFPLATLTLKPQELAAMVMTDNPKSNPLGDFSIKNNKILPKKHHTSTVTFTGIGLFTSHFFAGLQPKHCNLGTIIAQQLTQGTEIGGYHHQGFYRNLNCPNDLTALEHSTPWY